MIEMRTWRNRKIFYNCYDALKWAKHYKALGYEVEWTCDDPEDNEFLWENL